MSTDRYAWLLVFYSVPSKPVNKRMRIWRKLAKSGAVPLKGSVYILPDTEQHYEFCEWLISEVISMGGDGSFVKASAIETLKQPDIVELFNRQREEEYRTVEREFEIVERRINSVRKGGKNQQAGTLLELLRKLDKSVEEIKKIDFFSSPYGATFKKRLVLAQSGIEHMTGSLRKRPEISHITKHAAIEDYQERNWITRTHPFVDRMASAWLIKKFIDHEARFSFIEDPEAANSAPDAVTYDVRGGNFTHIGELCTFEVLLKTFRIKNKLLKNISEIVHELDVKDGKYAHPETRGLEEVLSGIRKMAKSDEEALERGMAVFEMLYAARS